jgi:hypothetical protein
VAGAPRIAPATLHACNPQGNEAKRADHDSAKRQRRLDLDQKTASCVIRGRGQPTRLVRRRQRHSRRVRSLATRRARLRARLVRLTRDQSRRLSAARGNGQDCHRDRRCGRHRPPIEPHQSGRNDARRTGCHPAESSHAATLSSADLGACAHLERSPIGVSLGVGCHHRGRGLRLRPRYLTCDNHAL